jgi:hypothetical protein
MPKMLIVGKNICCQLDLQKTKKKKNQFFLGVSLIYHKIYLCTSRLN